jgi:hypothetical protein
MKDCTGKFYIKIEESGSENPIIWYASKQIEQYEDGNCHTIKIILTRSTQRYTYTTDDFKDKWIEVDSPYKDKTAKPFTLF